MMSALSHLSAALRPHCMPHAVRYDHLCPASYGTAFFVSNYVPTVVRRCCVSHSITPSFTATGQSEVLNMGVHALQLDPVKHMS